MVLGYLVLDGERMEDDTKQARWIIMLYNHLQSLFQGQEVFVAVDLLFRSAAILMVEWNSPVWASDSSRKDRRCRCFTPMAVRFAKKQWADTVAERASCSVKFSLGVKIY